ncbi:MAG: hypothetical protein JNM85_03960 [Chthonomonas sp.]|nr:hypothetical protein [Chthonomonas sp.]
MRKRKVPVFLVVAAVILASVGIFINLASSGLWEQMRLNNRTAETNASDPKGLGREMKANLRERGGSVAPSDPSRPKVEVERPQKYKPQKSETATSSQWY